MKQLQTLQMSLSRKQRVLLLVAAAVVVLGILAATVFRDNIASALRWMTYSQSEDTFAHNAQSNSLFLGLENNLLICTPTQIQLYSPTGTARLKETVSMDSPALNASGKYAVVYDVGGQQLKVIAGDKISHQIDLPAEESILCATINEKGWLAVTTKVSGYKGVVTVYNASYEAVLSIRLSSRYVSDAVVTPDCRGVYLISPGQGEGAFKNTLLYYTFSSQETPEKEVSLGSNVVLSIRSSSDCWILGDKDLFILDSSGTVTASYDYEGQYLKMGSLHGNDFATLLLSRSASGSAGSLVTVGPNGKPYGKLEIQGQAVAMAAQGNEVALLTTGDILTAKRNLESYYVSPNQKGYRNLAMYKDGSLAMVSSASVSLFFQDGEKVENKEEGA